MGFDSAAVATSGNAELDVRSLSHNGGRVELVGRGAGQAARLPAYDSSDPRFAVLTVQDRVGSDDLAPGTSRFRFGADFRLDGASQGAKPDNGNNLMQRGLFSDSTQYKIDVDDRRPGCRVKGSGGAVGVRSTHTVAPDTWYQVSCTRDGASVTLSLTRLSDGQTWTSSGQGTIGAVASSRAQALSVGGKVHDATSICVDDADQFNGVVDDIFLNVIG